MKLNLYYFLACLGLMLSLAACGDDDPEIPRDHDVTMTVEALVHTLNSDGEASISVGDKNTFVFHPKTLTADMKLTIGAQTLNVQQVPVNAIDYTYRYSFNSPTTSNADITNLNGIFDIADPLAIFQCNLGSKHICFTIPDIFFEQSAVDFNYTDGSTSRDGDSYWIFSIDNTGKKADITINNIFIAKDIMMEAGQPTRKGRFFSAIIGRGATVTPTATGMEIKADEIGTLATYGNGEHVVPAYQTDNYPIRDLDVKIDLTHGTYQATMVIRHILSTNDNQQPTEWDDINVSSSGIIYKETLLD